MISTAQLKRRDTRINKAFSKSATWPTQASPKKSHKIREKAHEAHHRLRTSTPDNAQVVLILKAKSDSVPGTHGRWSPHMSVIRQTQDHPLTLTPKFGPGVTPGARLTRVVSLCVGHKQQDAVLAEDTIVERKTSSTRRGVRKSYRIRRKGQRPSAAPLRRKKGGVIRDNLE
ncbi:hypothetical protein Tco_1236421 [Tanacetum coccineum]